MQASARCKRCGAEKQTLAHILSSCCLHIEGQNRVTWRHNSILRILRDHLLNLMEADWEVFMDLPDSQNSYMETLSSLLGRQVDQRPDVILVNEPLKLVYVAELTSCSSQHLRTWHERKSAKYDRLCREIAANGWNVQMRAFEVDQIGFVASSTKSLLHLLGLSKSKISLVCRDISGAALNCSYEIFKHRDTRVWPWPLA